MTDASRVRAALQQAVDAVRARTPFVPEIAIVLGTGLGGLAREIAVETAMPYGDIPHFPLSTVERHAGRLLFGELAWSALVIASPTLDGHTSGSSPGSSSSIRRQASARE